MKISEGVKKRTKFVYLAASLLFFLIIIINLSVLIKRIIDKNNLDSEIKEINDAVCAVSEPSQNIGEDEKQKQPNTDYFNYLKTSFDDIDIKKLKNINSDTVGFLNVSGTNINYPVVQATDNEFYLSRSFKKANNKSGWLFMDYRNNAESFGRNTIIYGHSNLDKTMFGSLSNVLNDEWRGNSSNGKIKFVNMGEGVTNWQIISVYTVPAESYYIKTDFESDESFANWLSAISGRSMYNFGYKISSSDKIMTFSTCYKNERDIRLVVHARKV